jgi:hypothetical protein
LGSRNLCKIYFSRVLFRVDTNETASSELEHQHEEHIIHDASETIAEEEEEGGESTGQSSSTANQNPTQRKSDNEFKKPEVSINLEIFMDFCIYTLITLYSSQILYLERTIHDLRQSGVVFFLDYFMVLLVLVF